MDPDLHQSEERGTFKKLAIPQCSLNGRVADDRMCYLFQTFSLKSRNKVQKVNLKGVILISMFSVSTRLSAYVKYRSKEVSRKT